MNTPDTTREAVERLAESLRTWKRGVFGDTHEDAAATLTALLEKVSQLEGALALGQENCDAAYDDLREERDEAMRDRDDLRARLLEVKEDRDYCARTSDALRGELGIVNKQLTAAQARVAELETEVANLKETDAWHARYHLESEAREAKLREALRYMMSQVPLHSPAWHVANNALNGFECGELKEFAAIADGKERAE